MKHLLNRSALTLIVCALFFVNRLQAQDTIYYNAGGPQFISAAGDTFVTGLFYTMNATTTFTNNNIVDVLGTTDDQLYRSERSSNTNGGDFGYSLSVANGTYNVKLHFAEIFFGATGGSPSLPPHTGKRVFDVSIEGALVLDDYDIFADVGAMTAVVKEFDNVAVNDGVLNIFFDGGTNRPKVSALVISPISIIPSTNTPPTFTTSGNVTVDEDFAGTQTVTVTPDPVPPADAGQTVTYSISPSVPFANVSINASSGLVSITKVNNGNGSQLFTITANDGQPANNIATQTFTLTVNAVNDAPAFTISGNVTVNENFAGTQNVTVTPAAVPADEAGQTVTYTLDPPSVAFANVSINSSTGLVSITAVADANGSQLFTITANDVQGFNNTATQNFTLTVNDNVPAVQGPLHYNAGGAQYVSLAGDTFKAEPAGILSGTTAIYTNPTSGLAIASTDDDVLYRSERSTNLNLGSWGYNIPVQNGTYTVKLHFAEIFYGATGGNNTNPPHTGKRVFDVSLEGNLVLNQYDIVADVGSVTAVVKEYTNIEVTDANLDIDFAPGANGANKAKISAISVIPTDIAPPSNTAPSFTVSGNVTVDEDFAGTSNVTVTPDPVPPADAGQIVTYTLSPPSVAFANVSIDGSTGLVSITSVSNANGSQLFTITANDGQASNNIATQNFTLTVNAVNDAPAFTTSGDVTVDENFAGSQSVTVTPAAVPADETGQTVTYSLDPSSVAFANVSINTSTGLVTITAVPNGHGAQNFTITADDGQGANNTATQNFTLTVNDTIVVPGNVAPTVSLSTPAEGASFVESTPIQIDATANDTDGSIAKVEFYEGANLLSTDFTFPYSFTWSNATPGSKALTAKAFDDDNASTTSAAVNITVTADAAPTVSITNPANGASFFEGQTITINATASDDVGITQVEFYAGATFLGADNSFPYSYSWTNATEGGYALTAKAIDTQLQETVSAPVNITVDTVPVGDQEALLIVGNLTLNNGDQAVKTRLETLGFNVAVVLAPASVTADANGKDLVFISSTVTSGQVNNKFTNVAVPVINCEQALSDDLGLASGSSGNSGTTPTTQTQLHIIGAGHPLAAGLPNGPVTIYAPAQTVTWGKPGVNAIAIASVTSNGSQLAIFGYETGAAMVSGNAPARRVGLFLQDAGAAFLTASGTALLDAAVTWAANSTPPPVNTPPTASITSPANGASFTALANIQIDANANDTDGSIAKVEFYEGANLLGTDFTFPYSFNWINATAGSYQLTAKAFDNLNASVTSTVVNITVNPGSSLGTILLVVGNASLNSGDNAVKSRLQTLGYTVVVKTATAAATADAVGMSIVYISSTVNSTDVGSKFTNVAVPVLNCEQALHDDLKLVSASGGNAGTTASSQLSIVGAGHPLAAGLPNGTTAVYTSSQNITWGKPGANAVKIATTTGNATNIAIFGYETNATMVGLNAPARRVGFFPQDVGAAFFTANGTALFDAAINWLVSAPAPNILPTVNITSPANGATFTALANITIDANANDTDGSISKVEFYEGANLLGTDFTAPYSFNWNNVGAGSYQLTAKAFDNLNASATSVIVNVTVNPPANLLPSVNITSPANGASFTALANITIDANANDTDGSISKVEFYEGANLLGTDFTAPYSVNWANVPAGSYQLTAKAFDNLSASTTSAVVNISVNPPSNLLPTVNITSPANGKVFTAPANITINANANDTDGSISKVEFYEGANLLGTDLTAPYSFDWNGVTQGSYALTAKAFDNVNASTTSVVVNITVNQLPTVSITSPAEGTVFSAPANITIQATALDVGGSIDKVEFYRGAVLLGTDFTAPYSFDWNGATPGNYALTAKAFDNLNATATSAVVNIVVNQLPTVSITSPANGASFTTPVNIQIDATASDAGGSIAKVEFYQGATLLGTDFTAPYSVTWNSATAGNHQLTAKAFDNLNGTTTSAIVNITVNPGNQAPVVNITSPANNTTFTGPANISIQAAATDDGSITKVEFYVGATLLGTDMTFPYSLNWNGVGTGTYQLTAKAFDNFNVFTVSPVVTISVNPVGNNPPTVSITSPANGAAFIAPANIQIDAIASDAGGSVTKVEFYRDAFLLGTDFTAPYSFNWNGVPAGIYQLTAKAYDNLNVSTTSMVVNILVNNPTIQTVLFVVGSTTLNTGDAAVKAKLENMGFAVAVSAASAVATGDAAGKALVLISSTVVAGNVGAKFTNVTVPVINWEAAIMDDMKMTGAATTEYGTTFNQTDINITGAGHPLAAGLPNGLVTVVNSVQTLTWGKPNGNAVSIAHIAGNPAQVCIFGYTTGSAMFGINAPARRVGFMVADNTPAGLTEPGMQLLEAAILWATGTSKTEEMEPAAPMERTPSFDVNVYPNPSAGAFNIELDNAAEGKLTIEIFNYTGQEVYRVEKNIDAGNYREGVDLSAMSTGVYMIRMTNGESMLVRRVLIGSR